MDINIIFILMFIFLFLIAMLIKLFIDRLDTYIRKVEETNTKIKTQEEIQKNIHKFIFEFAEVLTEENNCFVNTFCKIHKYKRISELSYYSTIMIKDWIKSKNIELQGKREYLGDILEQIERD